jgi:hypothetical protein
VLRYPEKFILLATTGIAFAGDLGWNHLLTRRLDGERQTANLPLLVALLFLAAATGFLLLPVFLPELALSLVAGGSESLDPGLQTVRLGFLGREAAVMFLLSLGSVVVLTLHKARRVSVIVLTGVVLMLTTVDLYRHGHRLVSTADATEMLRPPRVLRTLPWQPHRIYSDQIFFADAAEWADPHSTSTIPGFLRPPLEQLDPYVASLWGLSYALNEDFDLMLTRWAAHALTTFHTRLKLAEDGWTNLPRRYLGAWSVDTVVRRRAPEAVAAEHRRTGAIPDRVRLVENPYRLPRFRFVPGAELHSNLETAVGRAEALGFDLSGTEFLIVDAEADSVDTRTYAADARVSSLQDRGADIEVAYTSSGPALLIVANTFDRGWRGVVNGNSVPLYPTAIGQMGVEVPAGEHQLTLRYRDPWVMVGTGITLLTVLACIAFLARKRILISRPLPESG